MVPLGLIQIHESIQCRRPVDVDAIGNSPLNENLIHNRVAVIEGRFKYCSASPCFFMVQAPTGENGNFVMSSNEAQEQVSFTSRISYSNLLCSTGQQY